MFDNSPICADDEGGVGDTEEQFHRFQILDDAIGRTAIEIVNQDYQRVNSRVLQQGHEFCLKGPGDSRADRAVGAAAATACFTCHTSQKNRDYVFSSLR
jgi:hypothetical protein